MLAQQEIIRWIPVRYIKSSIEGIPPSAVSIYDFWTVHCDITM